MSKLYKNIRSLFIKLLTDIFLPFKNQKKYKKHIRKILINASLFTLFKVLYHQKEWDKQTNFKYYLSLVLCVKDEADYILEWIEYYLLQGVEHFYVYNNNGTDNTEELLKPYIDKGIVTWHVYPGKSKQREIYNNALKKYRFETRWMGFIDVDEFIVSPSYIPLSDILKNYEAYNQLSIPFICYGTSGHQHKTNDLVIERFTRHGKVERFCKSIVNPRKTVAADVHLHAVLGKSVDEKFDLLYGSYPQNPTANILRINHYVTKSVEEAMAKLQKGGSSRSAKIYQKSNWFEKANHNEETDDIMAPYIPILKQKLGK